MLERALTELELEICDVLSKRPADPEIAAAVDGRAFPVKAAEAIAERRMAERRAKRLADERAREIAPWTGEGTEKMSPRFREQMRKQHEDRRQALLSQPDESA